MCFPKRKKIGLNIRNGGPSGAGKKGRNENPSITTAGPLGVRGRG